MATNPTELPQTMKAWTFTKAGLPTTVLNLITNNPLPTLPTSTSLLIRVSHVSLHPGTIIMTNFIPFLCRRSPSIAETDFSGIVVSGGKDVPVKPPLPEDASRHRVFPPGTKVFGSIPVNAHIKGSGALAEYVVVEMDSVAVKPANISFAEAAGLAVSGATALALMDAAKLNPQDKLLINSPCGGIGHFAVQIAAHTLQESNIVGVCSAASNETAKRLGCSETVDYNTTNGATLETILSERFGGDKAFDAVVDAHGSQGLWYSVPGFLKSGPGHAYTSVGPALGSYTIRGMLVVLLHMVTNKFLPSWAGGVNREYRQIICMVDVGKLERLRKMAEEGILKTLVGEVWDFEDAIQAYELFMGKHAKGKLVIRVWEPSSESH